MMSDSVSLDSVSINQINDKLVVLLHGKELADIVVIQGKATLIYRSPIDKNFSISSSMPPRIESYSGYILENWIWNLLPDSIQTLQWIARDTANGPKCSDRNPFRLIAKVGEECSGAIQIVRPDRVSLLNPGEINPLSVQDVELRLRGARRGKSPLGISTAEETGGYFSLAGAQPKLALRKIEEGWAAVSGAEPTSHILKPPMPDMEGQIEGEHFCLALARLCGLPAASSEIVRFGEEVAIAVERFDRHKTSDGKLKRIHVEDMCQALGNHPRKKYQSDGGPCIADICRFLRQESHFPNVDVEIFFRACIFNWLIGGTDAHAKNYSVFVVGGKVILSPLYDINTYLPYTDRISIGKLSMSVGKRYEFGAICLRHWEREALKAGMPVGFDVAKAITEMAVKIRVGALPLAEGLAALSQYADRQILLNTAGLIIQRVETVIVSLQEEKRDTKC
ncbi:HipA domain-containing protein [Acetobacter indonesiensis]|uniref:HipA domain-containing protein n=1 Tax=Acetobacter indonesiensis TaxID=104101 RepID=UPI001F44A8B4|nr:HipA domain-containing protein [Acetobacter indonesiensis]MCG0995072.1 HipA domain-containing protein [Acetobacter indonesiensis]